MTNCKLQTYKTWGRRNDKKLVFGNMISW